MIRPPSGWARGSHARRRAIWAGCLALVVLVVGAVVLATRPHGTAKAPTRAQGKPTQHTEESRTPAPRRLFAAGSPWNSELPANPALDGRSSARVAELAGQVEGQIAKGGYPAVAASSYSTPVYVVGAQQRKVPVRLDTGSWGDDLRRALSRGVPIPKSAKPAAGTDAHMTIYQPSTDRLWEFWGTSKRPDGWHARWGGAMQHVSTDVGYYTRSAWPGLRAWQGWNWGSTASSLPVAAGLITGKELRTGNIDHALAVAIPTPCARVFAWPAQRTDGTAQPPNCIPEGARLRLDPKVDVASLGLSPVATKIARAAQTYGLIVRDRTGGSVSFYAEDVTTAGRGAYARTVWGNDPWWKMLDRFPWRRLQVLEMKLCSRAPCQSARR
jgi:hypothetical protein